MKSRLVIATGAALVAGAALAAPMAPPHARLFLTKAMEGDNSEVALGTVAMKRGSSPRVRDFGQMLVTDHGKAKTEVAALAGKMGMSASARIAPEAAAERTKLMRLKGAAFDREFARYMVSDHKKDIAKFEAEAHSRDPAPVTALATSTLPTLRHHLEVAQKL